MTTGDLFNLAQAGPSQLEQRVSELRAQLREADPIRLAGRTGAVYGPITSGKEAGKEAFHLPLWKRPIFLTYPGFVGHVAESGAQLGIMDQALLAYYFAISDGTGQFDKWISFFELPDGKFYAQAFQGYTGHELAKAFGNDGEGFGAVCHRLDGIEADLGDHAFTFQALPHVALLVVCWLGDEDFPPSYRVLFDAAAGHHLSTDACAILGSTLCRRLIKAYRPLDEEQGLVHQ